MLSPFSFAASILAMFASQTFFVHISVIMYQWIFSSSHFAYIYILLILGKFRFTRISIFYFLSVLLFVSSGLFTFQALVVFTSNVLLLRISSFPAIKSSRELYCVFKYMLLRTRILGIYFTICVFLVRGGSVLCSQTQVFRSFLERPFLSRPTST